MREFPIPRQASCFHCPSIPLIIYFRKVHLWVENLQDWFNFLFTTIYTNVPQKGWWIVKSLSISQSRTSPSVFYKFIRQEGSIWRLGLVLPSGDKGLCFTSRHIQALHHREFHNIDPGVSLCVTMVIGMHSGLHWCLSVGVLPLKWWRAGPL